LLLDVKQRSAIMNVNLYKNCTVYDIYVFDLLYIIGNGYGKQSET